MRSSWSATAQSSSSSTSASSVRRSTMLIWLTPAACVGRGLPDLLVVLCYALLAHACWQTGVEAVRVTTHPVGELRVLEGDEANFGCTAEDPLVTRLEWRLVNRTSDFDLWTVSFAGRVHIPRSKHNLSGVYECRAFTGAYQIGSATLAVTVLRPLRIETFQTWIGAGADGGVRRGPAGAGGGGGGVRSREATAVMFTCRATSDAPIVRAAWLWRNSSLSEISSGNGATISTRNEFNLQRFSLVVANFDEQQWRGKFSCWIENDFGQVATAHHSVPGDPATPRVEVFRELGGVKLRLTMKKHYCAERIEMRYYPSDSSSPPTAATVADSQLTSRGATRTLPAGMISISCRPAGIISSIKQLVSGNVDIVVAPGDEWGLRPDAVYYGEAAAIDERGKPGPPAKFVLEIPMTNGSTASKSLDDSSCTRTATTAAAAVVLAQLVCSV